MLSTCFRHVSCYNRAIMIYLYKISINVHDREDAQMPIVSLFVYSDSAQPQQTPQGNQLHILNPQHILRPMFIPGQFSFAITFGILDFDTSIPHLIKYTFSSPNGDILIDTGDGIQLPPIDNVALKELPLDMRGFLSSLEFKNIVFATEGEYKSEIFFDGVSLDTFGIKVKGMSANVPSA